MEYVWFEDVRVFAENMRLLVAVKVNGHNGAGANVHIVPLPVVILHPDCKLEVAGDEGRLGLPRWWAKQRGLCD